MSDIIIGYCGIVCSSCGAYKRGRCEGCYSENRLYKSCKVRACNIEKGYSSCADCKEYHNLRDCKKLNNFMSKIFSLIFIRVRMELRDSKHYWKMNLIKIILKEGITEGLVARILVMKNSVSRLIKRLKAKLTGNYILLAYTN